MKGGDPNGLAAISAARIDAVPVLRRIRLAERDKVDLESLASLAAGQHGVVSSAQLQNAGLTRAAISRWAAAGRLHRIYPRVYALGHWALSLDGRLFAALLYGGEGAVLSHTTAAWAWSLVDAKPTRIHITVTGRCPSLPEVRVHHSRGVFATESQGFPVTSVARTLIDLAGMLSFGEVRRALAEADFQKLLDSDEVMATLGRGRRGSGALRRALKAHLPELAETLSVLEGRFLELCQAADLLLPEVNARVGGMRIDAVWREQRLAVELDGGPAHGGAAAMKRDRQRELVLRAEGFQVVRYSWDQIVRGPAKVAADLRRLLGA